MVKYTASIDISKRMADAGEGGDNGLSGFGNRRLLSSWAISEVSKDSIIAHAS